MVNFRLLDVDLTSRSFKEERIDDQTAAKFVGGLGVGTKLLYERVPKGADPLGPKNLLIIMTGPATGTPFPLSGRHHVVSKSPLTGTIGDANSGGNFGAMLRRSGWDGMVISGASETPLYITIIEGEPKFRPAGHLWGKGVRYTEEKIRHELEVGSSGSIMSIGPAGENLSPISAIMNDKDRAAGRTGLGAVLGSKKLKAVYAKPHLTPPIHDPAAFEKVAKEMREKLAKDKIMSGLTKYGTEAVAAKINTMGAYPTRNFQTGVFPGTNKIDGEALAKTYLTGNKGCWGCTVRCARLVKVKEPPHQVDYEGAEYEGIWSIGANCGVDDLAAINKAYFIENDMGLDVISYGATVACAMELYEKGKIPKEKLHGLTLEWGNPQAAIDLAYMTGYRTGLGDDIAMGAKRLAEKYGAPELAMHAKGLELPAYDPRGLQGMGLAYATSNRGGCHLRSYPPSIEAFGIPYKADPLKTDGKAEYVVTYQNFESVTVNSLVCCRFLLFAYTMQDFIDLVNPLTGWDWTVEKALKTGEMIYNLGRKFSAREGVGTEDTLPKRLLEEPMPEGPAKGYTTKLTEMLGEYYRLRGWVDGVPTREKLEELGIAD